MGKILLYAGAGYVFLVLVSAALFTGPSGLPLLILAAVVFFLYRAGTLEKLDPRGNVPFGLLRAAQLPALPSDELLADALRYVRRFDGAARRLAAAFPEDSLENPALVAVLAAYLHEPAEARESVEDEYRGQRVRFLAWRQNLGLLGSPHGLDEGGLHAWLQEARDLDVELSAIETYAAEIRSRAEATDGLTEKALEQAARAGELLASARAAAAAVADSGSARALNERLDVAQAKHREAWSALEKGNERPVTARRLADEAAAVADDIAKQAARIAALPKTVERRLSALATSIEGVRGDVERVHEEFEAAAASYAPSCWHEIGGVGHAARRALERARRLHESALRRAGSGDVDQLERAERDAEEAGLAVADGAKLAKAIERHLAKLEAAAVDGRERVVRAEQELDRAWSALRRDERGGGDDVLRRAADFVQQARDGLGKPQPDWLTIVELADRGAALAQGAHSGSASPVGRSRSRELALDDAKARAKEARDSAWACAIVRPATAEAAPGLLEAAEKAYQAALRAETSITESSDEGRLEAAFAAFESAERAARAFSREVEGLQDAREGEPDARETHVAHTLVWDLQVTRTVRS